MTTEQHETGFGLVLLMRRQVETGFGLVLRRRLQTGFGLVLRDPRGEFRGVMTDAEWTAEPNKYPNDQAIIIDNPLGETFRFTDGVQDIDGEGAFAPASGATKPLIASNIDVPGPGLVGFHVDGEGNFAAGGTTATSGLVTVDAALGDVNVIGNLVQTAGVASFDTSLFDVESAGVANITAPAGITLLAAGLGVYLIPTVLMTEQVAWPTIPANTLGIMVKDKGGISALYAKNDAGTEYELGAASPLAASTAFAFFLAG